MTRKWGPFEITSHGNVGINVELSDETRYRFSVLSMGIFGMICAHTWPWSAPVHEFGHWLAATFTGRDATIVAWTQTIVDNPTPFIGFVGYPFEALFLGVLAYLCASKRWARGIAFMLGCQLTLALEWGASTDVVQIREMGAHVAADWGAPLIFAIFLASWSFAYRRLAR